MCRAASIPAPDPCVTLTEVRWGLLRLGAAGVVALGLAAVAGAAKAPPGPERIAATFTIKNPRGSTLTCMGGGAAYTRTYGDYAGSVSGSFEGTVRLNVTSYVNGKGLGWISGGSLSIRPGKSGTRSASLSLNAVVEGRHASGFVYGQVTDSARGKLGGKQQIFATVILDLDRSGITGGRLGSLGKESVPAQGIVYPQSCDPAK